MKKNARNQRTFQTLKARRAKREATEAAKAKPTTKSTKPAKKKPAKAESKPVDKFLATFPKPETTDVSIDAGDLQQLNFLPHSELLPFMSIAELETLAEDIEANGQRDPIVLHEGKILDGRNRYVVLAKLKRRAITRDFDLAKEGDPLAYVYSKAVHRNLSEGQKAACALQFLEQFESEAKRRMRGG